MLSQGGNVGGYVLYIQDDKLVYEHNYVGKEYFKVISNEAVPEGSHKLRFEFETPGPPNIPNGKGAPGLGQLYFDGTLVGQGEIPFTVPLVYGLTGGIYIGGDPASPISRDYELTLRRFLAS